MKNHFSIAALIAFVYVIAKFLEMRFVLKEAKPVKEITRDTLVVYISSVLALFTIEQVDASDIGKSNGAGVFVGDADF